MTKPNTQAAKTLGAIAFSNGTKCIPCLDNSLNMMFADRQAGDKRTVPEIKAWIAGWTQANLSFS